MFIILLVCSFLKSSTSFFYKDSLSFSVLKETSNILDAVLTDFGKVEKDIYYDFSYLKKISTSYYIGATYKNLDFDRSRSMYSISVLRGFFSKEYFGILLLNYSLLKFYKYNSFLSLAMQTGKKYNSYTISLNYFYYISLNSYLSDRLKVGIDTNYKINNYSSIALYLYYFTLFSSDNKSLEYSDKYLKSDLDLGLAYSFKLSKIKLDLYSDLVFNREVNINKENKSNNYLIFGLRLYYLGVFL